jgi:phenylpropionate dioxygenase-like ring-hydroxylating dioxygenase large terminal subunit
MRHERQVELLRRLQGDTVPRPGPLGVSSMHNAASAYTSESRFQDEQRALFRSMPVLAGLSCEVAGPGDYLTADLGGLPIVIVRQPDGALRALVNVCRHRGARLLDERCGSSLRRISCPYHSWTYGLDGSLRSFPGAEAGFDDVDKAAHGLGEVAVAEQHGLIFVRAAPAGGSFTVDEALQGAQDEIADYDLGTYVPVESRTTEWAMNWKLVMDTFTEPYHIPWLHKDSIAPYFLFDRWIYDAFGMHPRFIGVRKTVFEEFAKPSEDDWSLLPHATTQYLLVPGAVLVYQIDHVELWRLAPRRVDRTVVTTSLFAPGPAPLSEKAHRYYVKNLDVLLGVTNTEDFPLQERVQRNLASGALTDVVYGKMEPALVHYHQSVNAVLAAESLR